MLGRQHYRLYAIHHIPSLKVLDFQKVTNLDRCKAERLAKSAADAALERDVQQEKTFVPGEGRSAQESFATSFTKEQKEQIRQMVAALQPQASSDKHRLIEIEEACKITRKAKPTIYTLARKGLIPAYKRGKKLYFYEDELLQWIESGRKQMQAMSLQEQAAEIVHGAKRKPKGGYNF